MDHPCKVLNLISWGAHINPTRYAEFSPKYQDWLNPHQKHEWRDRGLVIWDATTQVVTYLYANYALNILATFRETDTWKINGFVIGSPAYRMSISDTTDENLENKGRENDGWLLANQIKLTPKRSDELSRFLVSEEKTLTLIAADEDSDVREAYAMVVEMLLEREKEKKEPQNFEKREKLPQKKIIPISIPKGNYLTISQITEMSNVSEKQIEDWIRSGNFEAIVLPGIGKIVEKGKFTKFLNQHKSPGS
jgi:hypothetical protein